jgi:benzoate-CoA ligase family protein
VNDFTVQVDRKTTPTKFDFSPTFNVAVPFIDRHLQENNGGKIAVQTKTATITYQKLADQVNRCGNMLLEKRVVPTERVMMVVKDTPAFLYLFWGAIKAGIVPVPANTLLRHEDYAFMIDKTQCKALCYSPEYRAEIEAALDVSSHQPEVILEEGICLSEANSLDRQLADYSAELVPYPANAETDCFWLFSSGSTGRPKAAVHRHRDMVVTSELYGVGCLNISGKDIFYSAAKLFFAYGLGNAMTLPLWVGGTIILDPGKPTPQITFDNIAEYKPTLYFGVPTLYASLLSYFDELPSKPTLESVRACVSAGEALPADILKRWQERFDIDILDGIGSTEALHIFITNQLNNTIPGASGRVVPGYAARILDENDQVLGHGETGRLVIKGPSIARCYWEDHEQTSRTMKGEWLETGDTYVKDNNDVFTYCGRTDDMMKVGGIWCSPFEIEAKLISHPAVLESAVVAKRDQAGLIKPAAFIVLNNPGEGSKALKEKLTTYLRNNLAPYKFPRSIEFVSELPKTATGKVQRFRLRTHGKI